MQYLKRFTVYRQLNKMDCGPTCLKMIAKHFGKEVEVRDIEEISGYGRDGVSMLGISEAAQNLGFQTRAGQLTFDSLIKSAPLPCILHWGQNHFVVLPPQRKIDIGRNRIYLADPSRGGVSITKEEFEQNWITNTNVKGEKTGSALVLEPLPQFYDKELLKDGKVKWQFFNTFLKRSSKEILHILLALLLGSFFQFVTPFLAQSIVDTGINTMDLNFITLVLIGQLTIIVSRAIVDFVRARILFTLSIKLQFSLLSEFWKKLTQLPISYFDSYHTGDILQRIGDTKKLEVFLTGNALSTIFSFFNFVVFSTILLIYSTSLFFIFIIGFILYFVWINLFFSVRRKLNYKTFHTTALENSLALQLVQGMQELKLNNAENIKRWQWENTQASVFKLAKRGLSLNQWQQAGALLLNEGKNVVITFLTAKMVMSGQLTLGAMIGIQYIIGQLNSPVEQMITFFQSAQDAKMSLERLNEIHSLKNESNQGSINLPSNSFNLNNASLVINNLTFTYPGPENEAILNNISLVVPAGKLTAIVGASGSGKTTLLKLILKFYETYKGEIYLANDELSVDDVDVKVKLRNVNADYWRQHCSSVFQDGFIFNDTIANNIAIGSRNPEMNKLIAAANTANILSFIESLPNGFNSRIGSDGIGISQGQRQRILIARAIYKDPSYLFLDEATNALDANNEKVIVDNLNSFYIGRTVIVIAHRLSTVKNADQIVVLDRGKVAEIGNHEQLTQKKGFYYNLVKNQLELGK